MNKVILIGYMAADPEYATTQNGTARCNLRIAVQRRFADAQGNRVSDFFNVICWRQTAEFAAKYLEKGRKVAVEGSLQTRSYDAQDGSKRYVTEIIADNVEFCDKAPETGNRNDVVQQAQQTFGSGYVEVDDEELPFYGVRG